MKATPSATVREASNYVDDRHLRILMVEDVPADAELCQRELRRAGLKFTAQCVDTRAGFEQALENFAPDLILSDFSMPTSFDGLAALDLTRAKTKDIPFVFVSGTIGEDRAVEAMKRGATDYVLKDRLNRLIPVIQRALQEANERAARHRAEEEISRQRAFLRQVIDLDRSRIFAQDREGRYTLVNQAMADAYGHSVEDLLGKRLIDLNPDPDLVERLRQSDLEVLDNLREVFIPEQLIRDPDGTERWFQITKRPLISGDGSATMVLAVATDITERKLQELRIVRLSRVQAVLSGINSAIVRIRDRQKLFEEACRIAVEDGGFGIAWIGALRPDTLQLMPAAGAGEDADSFLAHRRNIPGADPSLSAGLAGRAVREKRAVYLNDLLSATNEGGERRKEAVRRGYRSAIALPLIVGDTVVANLSLLSRETNFFDDEELKLLTELAKDISFALDHIAKEEKLNYLAYYDVLTGLPNRTLFLDRLDQRVGAARREQESFAVVMVDIERFRQINETLGRQAGDALLREFTRRLEDSVGESDLVAHMGGDYFAIATRPADGPGDIARLLEGIFAGVSGRTYEAGGGELRIASRAGIAVFPADGADADSLLKNSEAALKDTKRKGDRYLFYAPQMNARVAEQLKLENDLRRAVLEEQFVLHYQARVDLATGSVTGFEALIRWLHPERGLVPPGEFIPLLERTGLILEAGRWALKRAAEDHAAWRARGLNPPRIAVNVSAIQLRRREFVEDVLSALAGADGFQCIDIEITESMLMEDIDGNIEKLQAIQAIGMLVAMDDFGTGYCSLSYLAKLPINSLKIDRSFVSQMAKGAEQMAIVSTIVSLARALRLKVTAEGVETQEQANLLRLLRCDEAQGFLFGRPEPRELADKRLALRVANLPTE